MLKGWHQQWPTSSRQRLAAAMLALDREDFDQAAKLFDQVDGVSGLLGQASVLVQQRRLTEASGKLEEAREKDCDRPGPKIALATLLAQGDKNDKHRAGQLCEEARGWGAESDAAALACRAQLALEQGLPRAAESLLQEAMERNPYGTHTSVLASVLIGMHRIDEAVSMLNQRIGKNREDSDRRDGNGGDSSAYFQLYRALLARGDGKAALSALRAALALAVPPASDTLAVALAYELEEQGSSAEAERLLRNRLVGAEYRLRRPAASRTRLDTAQPRGQSSIACDPRGGRRSGHSGDHVSRPAVGDRTSGEDQRGCAQVPGDRVLQAGRT